jgi:hypothetical protein
MEEEILEEILEENSKYNNSNPIIDFIRTIPVDEFELNGKINYIYY